jgi:hypothetical protein
MRHFCLFFGIILAIFLVNLHDKNGRCAAKRPANIYKRTPFNIFESENNTVELAQLGSNAELPCFIKYSNANLNISWWNVNTSTLLTTNYKTNARDKRFQAKPKDENTHVSSDLRKLPINFF